MPDETPTPNPIREKLMALPEDARRQYVDSLPPDGKAKLLAALKGGAPAQPAAPAPNPDAWSPEEQANIDREKRLTQIRNKWRSRDQANVGVLGQIGNEYKSLAEDINAGAEGAAGAFNRVLGRAANPVEAIQHPLDNLMAQTKDVLHAGALPLVPAGAVANKVVPPSKLYDPNYTPGSGGEFAVEGAKALLRPDVAAAGMGDILGEGANKVVPTPSTKEAVSGIFQVWLGGKLLHSDTLTNPKPSWEVDTKNPYARMAVEREPGRGSLGETTGPDTGAKHLGWMRDEKTGTLTPIFEGDQTLPPELSGGEQPVAGLLPYSGKPVSEGYNPNILERNSRPTGDEAPAPGVQNQAISPQQAFQAWLANKPDVALQSAGTEINKPATGAEPVTSAANGLKLRGGKPRTVEAGLSTGAMSGDFSLDARTPEARRAAQHQAEAGGRTALDVGNTTEGEIPSDSPYSNRQFPDVPTDSPFYGTGVTRNEVVRDTMDKPSTTLRLKGETGETPAPKPEGKGKAVTSGSGKIQNIVSPDVEEHIQSLISQAQEVHDVGGEVSRSEVSSILADKLPKGTKAHEAALDRIMSQARGKYPSAEAFDPNNPPTGIETHPTDWRHTGRGPRDGAWVWRSMGIKEFAKLQEGKKNYGGGRSERGNYLAQYPQKAAILKGKGKVLVEFAGAEPTGENSRNTLNRDNVTRVWVSDGERWVEHPFDKPYEEPSSRPSAGTSPERAVEPAAASTAPAPTQGTPGVDTAKLDALRAVLHDALERSGKLNDEQLQNYAGELSQMSEGDLGREAQTAVKAGFLKPEEAAKALGLEVPDAPTEGPIVDPQASVGEILAKDTEGAKTGPGIQIRSPEEMGRSGVTGGEVKPRGRTGNKKGVALPKELRDSKLEQINLARREQGLEPLAELPVEEGGVPEAKNAHKAKKPKIKELTPLEKQKIQLEQLIKEQAEEYARDQEAPLRRKKRKLVDDSSTGMNLGNVNWDVAGEKIKDLATKAGETLQSVAKGRVNELMDMGIEPAKDLAGRASRFLLSEANTSRRAEEGMRRAEALLTPENKQLLRERGADVVNGKVTIDNNMLDFLKARREWKKGVWDQWSNLTGKSSSLDPGGHVQSSPTPEALDLYRNRDPEAIAAWQRENPGQKFPFAPEGSIDTPENARYTSDWLKSTDPHLEYQRKHTLPSEHAKQNLFELDRQYIRRAAKAVAEAEHFDTYDKETGQLSQPAGQGSRGNLLRQIQDMEATGAAKPGMAARAKTLLDEIVGTNSEHMAEGEKGINKVVTGVNSVMSNAFLLGNLEGASHHLAQAGLPDAVSRFETKMKGLRDFMKDPVGTYKRGVEAGEIERPFANNDSYGYGELPADATDAGKTLWRRVGEVSRAPFSGAITFARTVAHATSYHELVALGKDLREGGEAARRAEVILQENMHFTPENLQEIASGKVSPELASAFRQKFVDIATGSVDRGSVPHWAGSRLWPIRFVTNMSKGAIVASDRAIRLPMRELARGNSGPAIKMVLAAVAAEKALEPVWDKFYGRDPGPGIKDAKDWKDALDWAAKTIKKSWLFGWVGRTASQAVQHIAGTDQSPWYDATGNAFRPPVLDNVNFENIRSTLESLPISKTVKATGKIRELVTK